MPRITVAADAPQFSNRLERGRRTAGLYAALARRGVDVEVVRLTRHESRPGRFELAPGLSEIRVPRTPQHAHVERMLSQRAEPLDAGVLLATQQRLTPDFLGALETSARGASVVIAAAPHLAPLLTVWTGAPLVVDARDGPTGTRAIEDRAMRSARLVLACSSRQAGWLAERHPGLAPRTLVVPDGIDHGPWRFATLAERREHTRRLGAEARPLVIAFAEAVNSELHALAASRPQVRFAVDGVPERHAEPGRWIAPPDLPAGLHVAPMPDRRLAAAFAVAAVAIREEPETPRSASELLLAAYAGIPILAGAAARDLGLPATDLVAGSLEAAVDFVLGGGTPDADSLRAGHATAAERTWHASADALLADERFTALLSRVTRPLRRPRRRQAVAA